MVRRIWQAIRLLHYEATVWRGFWSENMYRKTNSKEEETGEEEVVDVNNTLSMGDIVVNILFGNEEDQMNMMRIWAITFIWRCGYNILYGYMYLPRNKNL